MEFNPINKMIINEIGLQTDKTNRILDQDTGEYLNFGDKYYKYSSNNEVTLGKHDMPFDPANNRRLANNLFNYYTGKLESEDGTHVSMYYNVSDNNTNKQKLEIKIDGKESILTDAYYSEPLRYLDAIMRLNGAEEIDLSQYDKKIESKQLRKKK